jgi:protein-S-isoprenylcysteine O-methyltransferase Ste14
MGFFGYFQIGVLFVFFAVITTKLLVLRRYGINGIAVGRGKRGFQLFFELLSFTGFLFWMIETVLYATRSSFRIFPHPLNAQLFDTSITQAIGAALIVAGLGVFIAAYIHFGNSWRIGFDVDKPGELVTGGIFAFSRNPIYLFIDLWFIGVFLINGTVIFLIFSVLCLAHVHYQVLQEEQFLTDLYGEQYLNYRRKTGRYVSLPSL